MGHFLAVTAFRSDSVATVSAAVTQFLSSYGVSTEVVALSAPPDPSLQMKVFTPLEGWTVVLWPQHFNIHDFPLVRSIAASQNMLISTIHVYDDEYWEHLCCNGGTVLHEFCSRPSFWKEDSPEDCARMKSYASEPSRLAQALGIQSSRLLPYLADVDNLTGGIGKAFESDEFTLDNFWIFTDFWRQCGIIYPDPSKNCASVLRLRRNFQSKLPTA